MSRVARVCLIEGSAIHSGIKVRAMPMIERISIVCACLEHISVNFGSDLCDDFSLSRPLGYGAAKMEFFSVFYSSIGTNQSWTD